MFTKKYSLLLILVSMLFIGCQRNVLIDINEVESDELDPGSGFLEIETSPADANIYLDNFFMGKSPETLRNVLAGTHTVVLKKAGYEDSIKEITIQPGKKSFLDIDLNPIQEVEEKNEGEVLEIEEEIVTGTLESNGIVALGTKHLLFYDFNQARFTDHREEDSDIFSKRFPGHLVITRFSPVNIKVIDKEINSVTKEDCLDIYGQYEFLNSGQTLCVITKENKIVAMGGKWTTTEDAKLTWKSFS